MPVPTSVGLLLSFAAAAIDQRDGLLRMENVTMDLRELTLLAMLFWFLLPVLALGLVVGLAKLSERWTDGRRPSRGRCRTIPHCRSSAVTRLAETAPDRDSFRLAA
jgi:hypothetical protein